MFQEKIIAYKKSKKDIIYVDESGFAHDLPRTHGYALKGIRCYGKHDWGSRGRTNVIGALLDNSLLTISLFEGNINTDTFNSWLQQDLLPKLPAASIIVMDNAAFHKNKIVRENVTNAGHIIEYLPPYSPDLNPIEHKWAQAKAIRIKLQCNIDKLFEQHCV